MNSAKLIVLLLSVASLFAQSPYDAALKNLKFRSIGPATMGGRVDDLAVVESNTDIIYVGAAAGGIFKTVNGGMSWQAISTPEPVNPTTAKAPLGAMACISPWMPAPPGSTWA